MSSRAEQSANEAPMRTADLCDAYADQAQVCTVDFRSYGAKRLFAGTVVTVRCHEDNHIIRETVREEGAGRVLVVDGGASVRCALVGDNLATVALANLWEGVIINGAVRDVEDLANISIGVMAVTSCPRPPSALGRGEKDVQVNFGGIVFRPGDFVCADDDGVVVLPKTDM